MLINEELSFFEDEVIQLSGNSFCALVEQGSIAQSIQIVGIEGESEVLALACDSSASDYLFELDPETDLDAFLESSRLIRYRPAQGCIELADAQPLRQVLLEGLQHLDRAKMSRPWDLRRLKRWLRPNVIVDSAWQTIRTAGRFYGQLAICHCTIPGCSAMYAWIEENVCLLSVRIDAIKIAKVRLFPFAIKC